MTASFGDSLDHATSSQMWWTERGRRARGAGNTERVRGVDSRREEPDVSATSAVDGGAIEVRLVAMSLRGHLEPAPSAQPARGNACAGRKRRWRRASALVVTLGVLASACTTDEAAPGAGEFVDQGASVIVANSPGTITTSGPQRVLVALLGDGPNQFLGSADLPATIQFLSPDGADPVEVTGAFLSTSGVALGLYVASVDFGQVGRWEVRVAGSESEAASTFIDVTADSTVPEFGDPAPPSVTPTASLAVAVSVTVRFRLEPAGTATADTVGGVVSTGGGGPSLLLLLQAASTSGNRIKRKRV